MNKNKVEKEFKQWLKKNKVKPTPFLFQLFLSKYVLGKEFLLVTDNLRIVYGSSV